MEDMHKNACDFLMVEDNIRLCDKECNITGRAYINSFFQAATQQNLNMALFFLFTGSIGQAQKQQPIGVGT